MAYSEEWNEIYARGEQNNRWPWTDLVSAVKRHCGDIDGWQVLELGAGPNACNSQFFRHEGAIYTGIDVALKPNGITWIDAGDLPLMSLYPMDFTKELPPGPFDLIVDRAAVTHNSTEAIKRCLDLAYNALKPGGWYIGIDWFSTNHSDSEKGVKVDEYTRRDIPEGQFKDCGVVHFCTREHMKRLFSDFDIIENWYKSRFQQMGPTFAARDIVARKPQ